MNMYKKNKTKKDMPKGIVYSNNGYYVSKEGSNPNYHVWIPSITHAKCDSAYAEISLAICRCDYLAKNNIKL